jgi:DNA polymerase-3 subunit beta
MKISIARQELLDAVNKVKTVVSPKSALPILSHILFEAEEGVLKLTATDLKVSIECRVDCDVQEPGSLTVSSQRLASILGELPDAELTLGLEENSVVRLTCGKIETKLFSMSTEEFPPVRSFEGVEALTFPQDLLKKIFGKTSFAICNDQARHNLTGLLFEVHDGSVTVVATDGRRMSLYEVKGAAPEGKDLKVIIPGKMVAELERLLGAGESVEVFVDESQAGFSFDSMRLVTALIEGTFPNYDMVIPKKHDKEALVDTGVFVEAVRRTRTMTNEKFNSVRVTIEEGRLMLRVVTPEVGEYEEELPVEYEGEHIDIAFNPDFVSDVLRRVETEKTVMQLKDGMSPGVFRAGHDEEGQERGVNVIMPIRL